jgi:N-methylhydantoinase A/oxoprolinase/acetone carboxylase beta subunit
MDLHPDRSAKAIESKIAGPLGITLDEALRRMEDAHTAEIARALLATTAVHQDTVVAAFGGAGPMTVCGAARKAGIREVLIPRTAAVFSAFGIGFSDLSQVYEQPLPDADPATISAVAGRLRQAGARDLYAEGVDPDACTARFRLTVERSDTESVIDLDDPQDAAAHLRHSDRASLELALVAPLPHVTLGQAGDIAASAAGPDGKRLLRDGHGGQAKVPVYALLNQQPGAQAPGPAVIEGPFFTMLVPEGWQFTTTAAGDLRLTDGGGL